MVDIKRKEGYPVIGKNISGIQVYKLDIWNAWDDLALYKSLYRRPTETNLTFRQRILSADIYNSTKQGMINWLSDSFDINRYVVNNKLIYSSTYLPLSYMAYSKLRDKTEEYYAPRVIIDGLEVVFPQDILSLSGETIDNPGNFCYNYEKTVVYYGPISWTLWKNVDQTYFNIWETNTVPNALILKYQTIINQELYIVEETASGLSRDENGNIVGE